MYALATCKAAVLRSHPVPDQSGDDRPTFIPVAVGVNAAIQETSNTVFDKATRTPRTIRAISGLFPAGTDVQIGDRVRDDTHNDTYVVTNVTLHRAPGHQPDLQVTLKLVTP